MNSSSYPEPPLSREAAAFEVIMDHEKLGALNPYGVGAFDLGMRAALTYMLTGEVCSNLDSNSHLALRYVRDMVSVPGDMEIWSAKRLRQACEDTALLIAPQDPEDGEIIVEQRSRGEPNVSKREFGPLGERGLSPRSNIIGGDERTFEIVAD